jgi:predicted transcriptional regulator
MAKNQSRYRKNQLRRELIERGGVTAGLPLFDSAPGERSRPAINARIEHAPKAILVATDTRSLAGTSIKGDTISLSAKQKLVIDRMQEQADWSYQELARALDWSVNRVIPRVFELRELGVVGPSLRRACTVTGFVIQAWKLL